MGARFIVFAISAALTGSCWAQVTGRLTGSVTDASGAAIPQAAVNLFLPGGAKPLLSTVTTPEGLAPIWACGSGAAVGTYRPQGSLREIEGSCLFMVFV